MKNKIRIDPLSYAFAVGKIRALENYLFRTSDFLEMLNLDSEQIKEYLAKNRYYGDVVHRLYNASDIESFLNQQEESLDILVKQLLRQEQIFYVIKEGLFYPYGVKEKIKFFIDNKFLDDFFGYYIDFFNIRILFSLNENKKFLEGGFLPKDFFEELTGKSAMDIVVGFQKTAYAKIIERGIAYYRENSSFLVLEILMRSFLIDFVKPQKYQAFGIEPVIAYYLARLNEILILRIVLLGKLWNIDKDLLKEAIANTYV